MPTVDQMLRITAQAHRGTPYWVLEKDYALGYLLAGMAQVETLWETLVLKGGTALRKFYYADYRFSEDLDFSAFTTIQDTDSAMQNAIDATQALLLEQGPFGVTLERLTLHEPHPGGQDAFTVRVRFPSHREPLCRLKVEITYDEEIVLPPITRPLIHAYSHPPTADWHCYPLEEIVAEKLRAILQSQNRLRDRGWGASRVCRDYYDLWYILNHTTIAGETFPELLAQKCRVRDVSFETVSDFLSAELQAVTRTEWAHQLLPFVPSSPPAAQILDNLAVLLARLPLSR